MPFQTSLIEEIIIDNFAGGGGASTGIELATGRPVTIAINHDPDAIAMHKANHSFTEHYRESVWDIDPKEICRGRPVALAWFSPDCKHFSRAKGGKPVSKNIRGLAWVAVRWAAVVRPRVIMLENVPEFQTWCRIGKDGQPDFSRKGENFRSFVHALQRMGYEVGWQELKACDYGAPTIRKRFFLVARCDGKPVVFPKPTHGAGLKPYHTAAECIDWNIPCKSVFERKKPLAENTMKRIAKGLDKFTLKSPNPYITAYSKSGTFLLDAPHISKFYGGTVGAAVNGPLPTVTAIDHSGLAAAYIIQYHSETAASEVRGQSLDEPLMTVDGSPRYALASAYIAKYYSGDNQYSSVRDPLHTITTRERNALVEARLCVLRRDTGGRAFGHWQEVRELLNRYCGYDLREDELLLLRINGEDYFIADIGLRMLEPRELYKAQGFPEDYIIDKDCDGREYPRAKQIARCGNAVPPPFAEALVRANLPEWCGEKINTMRELDDKQAI